MATPAGAPAGAPGRRARGPNRGWACPRRRARGSDAPHSPLRDVARTPLRSGQLRSESLGRVRAAGSDRGDRADLSRRRTLLALRGDPLLGHLSLPATLRDLRARVPALAEPTATPVVPGAARGFGRDPLLSADPKAAGQHGGCAGGHGLPAASGGPVQRAARLSSRSRGHSVSLLGLLVRRAESFGPGPGRGG